MTDLAAALAQAGALGRRRTRYALALVVELAGPQVRTLAEVAATLRAGGSSGGVPRRCQATTVALYERDLVGGPAPPGEGRYDAGGWRHLALTSAQGQHRSGSKLPISSCGA